MAVFTIKWQISQCLERPDTTNWDQVMGYFLKVCKEFFVFTFVKFIFDPDTFVVG